MRLPFKVLLAAIVPFALFSDTFSVRKWKTVEDVASILKNNGNSSNIDANQTEPMSQEGMTAKDPQDTAGMLKKNFNEEASQGPRTEMKEGRSPKEGEPKSQQEGITEEPQHIVRNNETTKEEASPTPQQLEKKKNGANADTVSSSEEPRNITEPDDPKKEGKVIVLTNSTQRNETAIDEAVPAPKTGQRKEHEATATKDETTPEDSSKPTMPSPTAEDPRTEDQVVVSKGSTPYKLDHGNPKYPSNILCQDEPFLKCSRQCKHYNNILIYDKEFEAAGLHDRAVVFGTFLELAAYLCATVYVPPPRSILDKKHNGKKTVSSNLTWSDFFDSKYYHLDGGNGTVPPPNQVMYDWNPWRQGLEKWRKQHNTTGVFEYREVRATDISGFDQAANYSMMDDKPFVWWFRSKFWKWEGRLKGNLRKIEDAWDKPLRLPLTAREKGAFALQNRPASKDPTNLIYTPSWDQQKPPEQFESLADQIWNEVLFPNNTSSNNAQQQLLIGSWHIRRGDAARQCNTNLDRMRSYIQCTFGPLANRTHGDYNKQILVLVQSDEKNPEYYTGLKQAFDEVAPHITAIMGIDAKIHAFVREKLPAKYDNNFHVFLLANLIAQRKAQAFRLVHRRGMDCKDCYDLKGEIQLRRRMRLRRRLR